jgi:hypothetical protein
MGTLACVSIYNLPHVSATNDTVHQLFPYWLFGYFCIICTSHLTNYMSQGLPWTANIYVTDQEILCFTQLEY